MTAAPAGKYRRYTDEEREIAIAFCQAVGRRLASKQTGIPDTTIQAWMDGKDSGYNSDEIASIGRNFVQSTRFRPSCIRCLCRPSTPESWYQGCRSA